MKGYIEERVKQVCSYIVEYRSTVRCAARKFGISKSTVFLDVKQRIWDIDPFLARKVNKVLGVNKDERAIRGGNSTRLYYERKRGLL